LAESLQGTIEANGDGDNSTFELDLSSMTYISPSVRDSYVLGGGIEKGVDNLAFDHRCRAWKNPNQTKFQVLKLFVLISLRAPEICSAESFQLSAFELSVSFELSESFELSGFFEGPGSLAG
jgi:hypothetical protein